MMMQSNTIRIWEKYMDAIAEPACTYEDIAVGIERAAAPTAPGRRQGGDERG